MLSHHTRSTMPTEILFRQRTFFFSACCSGNLFTKTKTMKNFFFLLGSLLVSGFAFAQCEADHTVEASSFQYAPEVLNIEVGETVAFVNLGGQHDVNGIASSIDGMSFNNPEEFYLDPVMGGAEGVCTFADTREVSCGQCGQKTQTCTETCEWVDSSDCGLEGPCEPEATRMKPCGLCGFVVQLCTASCEWEDQTDCELQGDCAPGTTQNCGECGMQTCSESCRWQGCEGDGSRWRSCNDCGWQFCLSNGDYSTDCTAKSDPECPPPEACNPLGRCVRVY